MTKGPDSHVSIQQADHSLRKKIGDNVNMRSIFTPEKIAEGEKVIAQTKSEFADKIIEELGKLEKACQADFNKRDNITQIYNMSASLKGKAESLGYDLMAHILQSLCDYSEQHLDAEPHGKIILDKHLQSIRLSAASGVKHNRDQSNELLQHLKMLVDKYHG